MRDKALIKEKADQLVSMTTEFCEKHLDDEYAELCEKLIRKMARKRNVPFLSGRMDIWASGILFALCRINFAFEPGHGPCTTRDELCQFFDTNKSTTSQKATKIIDMLKLTYWDDDFSTERNLENDPFSDFIMVDGLIMPKDLLIEKILESGIDQSLFDEFNNRGRNGDHHDAPKSGDQGNETLRIVEVDKDRWMFDDPVLPDELDD